MYYWLLSCLSSFLGWWILNVMAEMSGNWTRVVFVKHILPHIIPTQISFFYIFLSWVRNTQLIHWTKWVVRTQIIKRLPQSQTVANLCIMVDPLVCKNSHILHCEMAPIFLLSPTFLGAPTLSDHNKKWAISWWVFLLLNVWALGYFLSLSVGGEHLTYYDYLTKQVVSTQFIISNPKNCPYSF
jgi:hypothetical protein